VLKAEEEIVAKQDTSGCTAICAIITPTHIVVRSSREALQPAQKAKHQGTPVSCRVVQCGNSGDSRAVVYSDTVTRQMSRDHKPYLEDEKKRIEDAGGHVQMQRVDGA
jgi:serine/threonine protein phosphatase PrpC